MKNIVEKLGVQIPSILLPNTDIDLGKWSVVACDQYTSQLDYWEQVAEKVGSSHSTFNIIFPEAYLEHEGAEERIEKINSTMQKYLEEDILVAQKPGFVYVDRATTNAPSRKGLILSVDLDKYDYTVGSQTLIRATEGTVIDRLPPRIKIRQNACIELPHIMLLIDDPDRTVIEPLAEKADSLEKLYDFELMMGGLQIKGYKIDDEQTLTSIVNSLAALAEHDTFCKKYGVDKDKGVLLFAVGDGNHSLASAKGHWENIKKKLSEKEAEDHPARFALVEVVNVHDEGLKFEPIHRVLFNIDPVKVVEAAVSFFGPDSSYKLFDSIEALKAETEHLQKIKGHHVMPFISKDKYGAIIAESPAHNLEVGSLQCFLDDYLKAHPEVKIDYIHGEEVLYSLGTQERNMGFELPPMDKNDLFKTVIIDGVLPRKTFSMGEAEEKRFYLECRKISK